MSELEILENIIRKIKEKKYNEITLKELNIIVKNLAITLEFMEDATNKATELLYYSPLSYICIPILGMLRETTTYSLKWWLNEISKIIEAHLENKT